MATVRRAKAIKKNGLACSLGATDFCKVGALGSIPIRSTESEWAHGPTGRRQLGRLEIRVQFPVGPLLWKVAGYGWPGRFAKPCDSQRVVWVQIPCLPLYSKTTLSPMVKRKSHFASNEVFQVQVLVGLLWKVIEINGVCGVFGKHACL